VSRRFEPDPNKARIVVTPETTDEDVRNARKLIHDGFGTRLRVDASERDPLTAVQVAIFHRRGWTVPRIANHFSWKLVNDEHGTPRRSSRVTDYINQGEELLDQQKNSRS
jgi:hypothetical protein